MHSSWHIGITGGIGSGKSTATAFLHMAGAYIIDTDLLARTSTSPDGTAIAHIRSVFGNAFINADGSMQRDAMRDLVFHNAEARRKLEAIIHPIVLKQAQALGSMAEGQGWSTIVYEIPLLAESKHWRHRLHRIIVVDCDEYTQIQRIMQHRGLTYETARSILATQASRADRLRIADAVIYNGAAVNQPQLCEQLSVLACSFGLMIASKEADT